MPAVVPGYSERLEAAADYVRDCHDRWKDALKARNCLIVEAIDHGYAGHQAARDTRLKQPHIIRILSLSDPEVSSRP
jgi:hypothetical protein